MSFLLRFLLILTYFLTFSLLAQESPNTIRGSFTIPNETLTPTNVNFTINWNEIGGTIQGQYDDNFFARTNNLSGELSADGRRFDIVFDQAEQDIKSLSIFTPITSLNQNQIPVTVTLKDNLGNVITSENIVSTLTTSDVAQPSPCSVGFGVLTNYCGIYSGFINETKDEANRCNILGNTKMELTTNGNIILNPFHSLGSLPLSPMSPDINIIRRNCGVLAGTTFLTNNCQRQNLKGSFIDNNGIRSFVGSYRIIDETNGESCTYSFSFTREVTY